MEGNRPMSKNGRQRHASLYDFRDLDLLLTIEDRADNEGWASTADLASSVGFGDNLLPLSRRLAWMRKYGMLEFRDKERLWRLTDSAIRVVEAKTAAATKSIERLPDEALVEVMADVTARYWRGSPMVATMLRREFMYGTSPRR
jgi:hypothetical protein